MKENVFKSIGAVIIAGISSYLGVIALPLVVLIVVMIIDYLSGMIKAWILGELSSRIGIKGIVKKAAYLMVVSSAVIVDLIISISGTSLGIESQSYIFGLLVTIWLVFNELISILENLGCVGVPMPKFLSSAILKLRTTIEEKNSTENRN